MKKQLLLILIVLAGACADFMPKGYCNVQYKDNGVLLTLKPDYSKTFIGGNVRYTIEVANVGEVRADNIVVECAEHLAMSELLCPKTIFNNDGTGTGFSLPPPDTTACVEGGVKQDQAIVTANRQTGEEPAYFRVNLYYSYSSSAWSEVTLISETQWKVRTQQGVKPVQSKYQSAAPVKIELGVPDAPVVYNSGPKATTFPVVVTLKNVLDEYSYPETSSGITRSRNKVDSVVLKAPEGGILKFVSGCAEITGNVKESDTCTITEMAITTEEDKPVSKVATVEVTAPVEVEETYKITAEAKYTYVVKKASEQGVEIGEGDAASGSVKCV